MTFTTAHSLNRVAFKQNRLLQVCLILFSCVWLSSLIGTSNFSNWIMENTLVVLFLILIFGTYKKFAFSDLSYVFITVYLCLHVYGAKYTYALNPFGFWLQHTFDLSRNHYDRIVHFSFGFMLAYPMRDYFTNHFEWPSWVCWILPCEITLSFSAMYELVEWSVADIFFPEQGDAYLGSQGDIWDAQKDMGLAFLGSILIMVLFKVGKKIMKT